MSDVKVYIRPEFAGPDRGEGGIRRVTEAQRRYLPDYGIEVVDSEQQADIVACHAGDLVDTRKPLVAHCHGLYNTASQNWSMWAWSLNARVIECLRRATIATATSEWVAMQLARGLNLDARVWHSGVDPEEWPAGESQGYVLWNKTRVDPVCDPTPLDVLARRNPDLSFVSTFGAEQSNVRLTGKVGYEEARDIVRGASVYLATSRETFGIGTLEAMASGVPVLGWRYGGQTDIVRHGVDGYLARPGDWDDLQEGLRQCLGLRDEWGANARERALSTFTWQQSIAHVAALYREAAGELRQRPAVSVIVTCYKLEEYLGDCLRSLQAQTLTDWECIVVDDCSPGDCAGVVAEFASDARIKYARTPRNLYLAGARNYGTARAEGRYILPLDADDMLNPRALDVLSAHLDGQPGHAIAYGAMEMLEPDGRRWVSTWPRQFSWQQQMQHKNQLPYASMYRREVWRRTGGYRLRCRTAEDADFWCRVTSFGFRAYKATDYPCLLKRERADSMGRTEWDPDWTAWYGWSRNVKATPFGSIGDPPKHEGRPLASWPVRTYAEPRVSVVIPVGPTHATLVQTALDSLLAQTEPEWEAVVVNDSGQPLDLLGYPWARVLDTPQAGSGPAVARNLGIEAASAPLVVCLDADDYLMPRYLERTLAAYQEHGGWVYTDWFQINQNAEHETKRAPDWEQIDLVHYGMQHTMACLFAKTAWREAGGFDPNVGGWEDWDFLFSLSTLGYCGTHVAEPLFCYRFWSGQRRETAYALKGKNGAIMRKKWAKWLRKGGAMGCSGCGRGGGKRSSESHLQKVAKEEQAIQQAAAGGMVLIEYTGNSQGTRSYKGSSGQVYRFGATPGHTRMFVYQADASRFVSMADFRVVPPEAPPSLEPVATEPLDARQAASSVAG